MLTSKKQADDAFTADYGALDECLSAATSQEIAASCVGITYQPCMERSDDGSRVGEAQCLRREGQLLDVLLQEETLRLLTWGHNQEREAARTNSSIGSGYFAKILEAEDLWRKNRTAQCEMDMLQWGAGTIASTDYPICLSRATARRIYFHRQKDWLGPPHR